MEGLKAFGIGAAAGTLGALTGGAAFTAVAGSAAVAGTGGFVAGAVSGMVGSLYSSLFLSVGNNIAFGDPLMSAKELGLSVLFGGVLGGTINGLSSALKGNSFWKGTTARVEPSVISKLNPSPIAGGQTELPTSNVSSIPNAAQPNTTPTTQANTITITKSPLCEVFRKDKL